MRQSRTVKRQVTVWAEVSVREKNTGDPTLPLGIGVPASMDSHYLSPVSQGHPQLHVGTTRKYTASHAHRCAATKGIEQSRASGKETGKEGQREPRMPSCPLPPAMSPGMTRRRQRRGGN